MRVRYAAPCGHAPRVCVRQLRPVRRVVRTNHRDNGAQPIGMPVASPWLEGRCPVTIHSRTGPLMYAADARLYLDLSATPFLSGRMFRTILAFSVTACKCSVIACNFRAYSQNRIKSLNDKQHVPRITFHLSVPCHRVMSKSVWLSYKARTARTRTAFETPSPRMRRTNDESVCRLVRFDPSTRVLHHAVHGITSLTAGPPTRV